jgi:hypothetical protein
MTETSNILSIQTDESWIQKQELFTRKRKMMTELHIFRQIRTDEKLESQKIALFHPQKNNLHEKLIWWENLQTFSKIQADEAWIQKYGKISPKNKLFMRKKKMMTETSNIP